MISEKVFIILLLFSFVSWIGFAVLAYLEPPAQRDLYFFKGWLIFNYFLSVWTFLCWAVEASKTLC